MIDQSSLRSVTMRYLAQFSEAPRTGAHVFWQDAISTEEWLQGEGKRISNRRLTLRARGTRALRPWLEFQTQPLAIDAWLDPMEITVTWSYLVRFLAELGPERVWIPCGEDAWVGFTRHQLVVRAARESWLWALVEDVWDPASWSTDGRELEWWSDERLQHAINLNGTILEQRAWATGWEEWTLSQPGESHDSWSDLADLWLRLVERLGARSIRVKWLQERSPDEETLLGVRSRYITCDLTFNGQDRRHWLNGVAQGPEPTHIRAQVVWDVPEWSADWSTVMTLRRVQRGSRLEATYTPRRGLEAGTWRSLQQERRHIPILQIRPLILSSESIDRWDQLQQEASSYHRREQLTRYLKTCDWPSGTIVPGPRIRLRRGWAIWRWASQIGLWVLRADTGVEVHIEWPNEAHPGNIGVAAAGSAPIPMTEWVRDSRFNRLSHDRRYWAAWVAEVLLPRLEAWDG